MHKRILTLATATVLLACLCFIFGINSFTGFEITVWNEDGALSHVSASEIGKAPNDIKSELTARHFLWKYIKLLPEYNINDVSEEAAEPIEEMTSSGESPNEQEPILDNDRVLMDTYMMYDGFKDEISVLNKKKKAVDTLYVTIYNKNMDDLNRADGEIYLEDMHHLLSDNIVPGIWMSAALAQSYTEGGAGKFGVYAMSNNCFGIRANEDWNGYVYARDPVPRVYDSYETAVYFGATDIFRAYDSMEDSVKDYVRIITTSSRYKKALKTDSYKQYLKILVNNGYGSTSMYSTWCRVINVFNLTKFDK